MISEMLIRSLPSKEAESDAKAFLLLQQGFSPKQTLHCFLVNSNLRGDLMGPSRGEHGEHLRNRNKCSVECKLVNHPAGTTFISQMVTARSIQSKAATTHKQHKLSLLGPSGLKVCARTLEHWKTTEPIATQQACSTILAKIQPGRKNSLVIGTKVLL